MARSTYNDQVQNLIDKGYLVLSHGNTYDFYEVPQPKNKRNNDTSLDNNSDEHLTRTVNDVTDAAKNCTAEDREINNRTDITNKEEINIENPSRIEAPKVREIVIKTPKAEGKLRAQMNEPKHNTFVF